ncbi:tRNA (N6-threonylcarbamoyladenosine(37)-N6)-methyltransferase TrmO [Brooklawnia cerclae]|uniref:tRNA-Thr(GGU) m(6)t(6)A37 methyltransferase TsaA n=1 Tax=Brooklawnia cerclae TaxID=349934 RepID=A0ABX0SEF1_9ACTN|nr:tRNA (N6-threonylcarbamoyladenosine(37)-N6)-methyltransferase TrmO [Brooklawnia cerclae]NIH56773.1 tRNA-Thr(GGU) m(6)t(6)A37 methyltransferase TsaA [Brooklawnia cerclae]
MQLRPVARMHSDFPSKFGIPRQPGLVPQLRGRVVFEPEFRNPDAVRGLSGFSHIWLVWEFSESIRDRWSPTVRPPRLGGEARMGVFATRSPFRPNPIGLSSVALESVESDPRFGPVLVVRGADLMDGSPIFDIKPYVASDIHADARLGFSARVPHERLEVVFPEELRARVPAASREALLGVLAEDPRPAYQDDPERVYGLGFAGVNVRFTVADGTLTVREVAPVDLW